MWARDRPQTRLLWSLMRLSTKSIEQAIFVKSALGGLYGDLPATRDGLLLALAHLDRWRPEPNRRGRRRRSDGGLRACRQRQTQFRAT
jgi:hypothetical protein